MNRPEGLPPSYEDAVRGTDSFAGASAPELSSPEKSMLGHMVPQMPQVPVGHAPFSGPVNPPGIHPVPSVPPNQPPSVTPQTPMPMYVVPPAPTTVYVTNPAVGPKPCTMTCPNCHQSIRTTITVKHSGTAHVICCLMCIFGLCCCSCLPYCMSGFKITKHECPSCKAYLGSYKS